MDVRDISLDRLIPSRNLRTEGTDVSELAESISEHGLLQPILVRPIEEGMFQVVAGHRRLLAYRALGRPTISAVVADETDQAAAAQSIVENLQREDLSPLELARGVAELATGHRLAPVQIARAVSKSPAQVATWIRLSRLPDDVLDKLESGEKGTQTVSGLTPRNLQPFVSDLPAEEDTARDPGAAARFEERVATVRDFQDEIDRRGVRLNAHMSDEVARRTRAGQMTVPEAVDEVLAHPDRYRYARPTVEELEEDTWAAYVSVHQQMSVLAHKLRPEIAGSFPPPQKRDLLQRLSSLAATLDGYRAALETGTRTERHSRPRLAGGAPDRTGE